MNQSTLALAPPPAAAIDRTGFEIGWDHAHHGLVPLPELLQQGSPLDQGWRAGKAVFGRRTTAATRHTRAWLVLRTQAWQRGAVFDAARVTAQFLAQIDARCCPLLRTPLSGAATDPDAAVTVRANPRAAFAVGNLLVLSRRADAASDGVGVLQALRHARLAQHGDAAAGGLDTAAWWRLAALRAFATALPFHVAVGVPLALLPPQQMRPVNAAQRLQTLLTLQFGAPGFSARLRAIAALLPEHALRTDFNLFVGALTPRVLEAGPRPAEMHRTLEDAWLDERVQRRWQHFALSLGEDGVIQLLDRIAAAGPAPRKAAALPADARQRASSGAAPRTARGTRSSAAPARRAPPAATPACGAPLSAAACR